MPRRRNSLSELADTRMAGKVSPSLNRRAVILFTGDPRREELRKGLPPRFLRHLHRELTATIHRIPDTELFIVSNEKTPPQTGSAIALRYTGCELALQIDQAVNHCRSIGYEHILLLAGDILGITGETLTAAFAALQSDKTAVIGESGDGGFYLAAFNGDSKVQWQDIPLHTALAADALRQQFSRSGLRLVGLPQLNDIDSIQDARDVLSQLRIPPRQNRKLRERLLTMLAPALWSGQSNRRPASAELVCGLQQLRAPPAA